MTKYNQSFKQKVIEFYLQNGKNRSLTRQHFQLAKTTSDRWINQYHHNGFNGLAVSHTKQVYSPEFKLSVVQAVKNGQFSAKDACLYFGIPNSGIVSQWLQAFDKQGINGLFPKPKGRPTMKPKYPKMSPSPKTEEERLRYRILELEAENAILKKWQALNQAQNAEKANVVKLLRNQFPLEMLLQLIGLKRSTFFYHLMEKVNNKNADIEQKIAEIYHENKGNYGYRRITLVLRRMWTINHKRVQSIMQKWGLKGKCKRRTYRSYQGKVGKIADNLLERNFQAIKPNEKCATDVTEFKCAEGKLYLSPIKDLFNGEIIAYDLAESPNFEQISRMMNQAVARLKGANRYYIPTKVGSIRWSLFGRFANETVLGKVCRKGKLLG